MSFQAGLIEIDKKFLKNHGKEVLYRFFMDSAKRFYLHLWQKQENDRNENFGLQKIQISNDEWAFEWKEGSKLKCARISSDEDAFKIKPSPLMIMQSFKDQEALKIFHDYLGTQSIDKIPELDFLRSLFGEL